jgi:hypothetical protein
MSDRSLEILSTKLGLNHPNTQQGRKNLATLYDEMVFQFKLYEFYDKVVEYLEKAIAKRCFLDAHRALVSSPCVNQVV